MRYYTFALDNGGGTEDLGGMALTDDTEAVGFATQRIQDLRSFGDHQHARWWMKITEGERIVDTIPFELGH
jgi:hypothetical protein